MHAAASAYGEVHGGASRKTVMRERATLHEPLARKREPAMARGNADLALDRRQQCADIISRAQRIHGERAVVPDEELNLPGEEGETGLEGVAGARMCADLGGMGRTRWG